jgi:hypothetical protein
VSARRKKRRPVGETIGGIIVGFDQQIFRTMPPVQELIVKGQPVRGLSGQDGSELQVVFPGDTEPVPSIDPTDDAAAGDPIEPSSTP